MTLLCYTLALAAFLLLAAADDARHRALFGMRRNGRRARALRLGAWPLLAASAVPAFVGQGAMLGGVVWAALVMAGAASAFMMLHAVRPRAGRLPRR